MLYVFLLKSFKEWKLEKILFTFLAQFFHKKHRFGIEADQKQKTLSFCFASSDILKAVTGCFEKLEISAKRFGLKNDLN